MLNQASTVFGNASSVFQSLQSAYAPIVAAGPNQQGFSGAENAALNTQATEGTAQEYSQAAKQVGTAAAAAGGGNTYVPSGATEQAQGQLAADAAGNISSQRSQITQANYAQGRQNFFQAAQGLEGADQAFGAATSASNAATGAGEAASSTANTVAQADNSWMSAVSGIIGSVGGAAMTGGMSNLGKGVGFVGQNAPAPG